MKPHNIPNNQNNPQQDFQRDDHSKLQNILQSLSNKNIMVMEQNRHVKPTKKTDIRTCNYSHLTKMQKHRPEKKQHLQEMVLRKLDIHMQKTKMRYISITLHKNYSKLIKDLNVNSEMPKLLKENMSSTLQDTGIKNEFQIRAPFA